MTNNTIAVGDKLYYGFNEVEIKFIFENPMTKQVQYIAWVENQGGLRGYSANELTTEPALFVAMNDSGEVVADINVMERAGDSLGSAALVIKVTKEDGFYKTETVHTRAVYEPDSLEEIMEKVEPTEEEAA